MLPAAYRSKRTPPQPTITLLKSDFASAGYAITPLQIDFGYDRTWTKAINCNLQSEMAFTIQFIAKYWKLSATNPPHKLQLIYGKRPKLIDAQREALIAIVESGPIPEIHGVVAGG